MHFIHMFLLGTIPLPQSEFCLVMTMSMQSAFHMRYLPKLLKLSLIPIETLSKTKMQKPQRLALCIYNCHFQQTISFY